MKRILFVDDEPRILQGLRRMLYGMRGDWQMGFANDAMEALALLDQQEFDVIITDMRMPGMDGAELLDRVSQLHPRVIRIIFSGQSDEAAIMRCIGKSHLYLGKPCDAETIKVTVTRACGLSTWLEREDLRNIVLRMESLPSLPSLYSKLYDEIMRSDASIHRVLDIVSMDISLITRMLHLTNSAYFGGNLDVSDFREAVLKLGLKTIGELLLKARVFSMFDESIVDKLYIREIMSHSVTVGRLAKTLAENDHLSQKAIGDSFSAGLIHDVGKLVLCANLPEEYERSLNIARSENVEDTEAERKVFGATHAEVGAYLLGLWGLPDVLVEAVAFHHRPGRSGRREIGPLAMLHAADVLAHEVDHIYAPGSGNRFDLQYLEDIDRAARLPEWKETRDGMSKERPVL